MRQTQKLLMDCLLCIQTVHMESSATAENFLQQYKNNHMLLETSKNVEAHYLVVTTNKTKLVMREK